MSTCYQLLFCTCPDKDTAEQLAHRLVADQLAACVNIVPGITSVYRWHEQIETAQEHLLLIKAHSDFYAAIAICISTHHPYETPELIAVSVENGLPDYLHWIDSCHSHI